MTLRERVLEASEEMDRTRGRATRSLIDIRQRHLSEWRDR